MARKMFVHKHGVVIVQVEGCDYMRYFFYSEREAIRKYRQDFGLVGKHLEKVYVDASFFGFL